MKKTVICIIDDEEEDEDDDQDIPAYGFPRNRREPSDIDFIISNAGTFLQVICQKISFLQFICLWNLCKLEKYS